MSERLPELSVRLHNHLEVVLSIGLRAALEQHPSNAKLLVFLDWLSRESTPEADNYATQLEALSKATDRCVWCDAPVEADCYADTQDASARRWHVQCLPCRRCGKAGGYDYGSDLQGPLKACLVCRANNETVFIPKLKQHLFRMYLALARFRASELSQPKGSLIGVAC